MKWPWRRGKDKHDEVTEKLDEHERELRDMDRRVRLLENEYGIVTLREVKGQ